MMMMMMAVNVFIRFMQDANSYSRLKLDLKEGLALYTTELTNNAHQISNIYFEYVDVATTMTGVSIRISFTSLIDRQLGDISCDTDMSIIIALKIRDDSKPSNAN
jgi:hypothetical protein